MTSEQTSVMVFKNGVGDYFVVPQETIESGRVPAEHKAEVERLIAQSADARLGQGDDVQGHFIHLVLGAAAAIVWGVNLGVLAASTNEGKASPGIDPKRLQQGSGLSRPL